MQTESQAKARKVFTDAAAAHRANGDLDQAARAELCREYFTNPEFRAAMADHLFEGRA